MVGFLFVSTSYIYGTLLTANNNLRHLNILATSIVVINISLNLILIPRYQAYGAAIASLFSQGIFAIMQLILCVRIIKVSINRDIWLRLFGFLAFNLFTGYVSLLIPGWIPGICILLASCLFSSLLLGLIRPREIREILASKEK